MEYHYSCSRCGKTMTPGDDAYYCEYCGNVEEYDDDWFEDWNTEDYLDYPSDVWYNGQEE